MRLKPDLVASKNLHVRNRHLTHLALNRAMAIMDNGMSRGPLVAALGGSVCGKGRRPLFDRVLMFNILVHQALDLLADEVVTRLFCERLVRSKAIDKLRARLDAAPAARAHPIMGRRMIDGAVVPAPKRLTPKKRGQQQDPEAPGGEARQGQGKAGG